MRRTALLTICLVTALAGTQAAFAQAPAPTPNTNKKKGGLAPKSKGEAQALQACIQAQRQTPDDVIKACDELVNKYADTAFKSFALGLEADAYQRKNDNPKAITYGEQALQADPKNFDADNLLANIYAQTTRDTDLDKADKLAKANKYAHDSLDTLQAMNEPPALYSNLTPEQWAQMKKGADAMAWQALGSAALVDKKDDEAVADFEKGLAENPDPVLMIRAGRALLAAKKPDQALGYFEKVMNSPDAPAQIKSIAQADRVRAIQAGAKPTTPPTGTAPAAAAPAGQPPAQK
jgi:tetratricopeptide (TPR) repeat protein